MEPDAVQEEDHPMICLFTGSAGTRAGSIPRRFSFFKGMFLSKAIALRMGAGWGVAEGAEDGDGIRRRRAVRGYEGPPAS